MAIENFEEEINRLSSLLNNTQTGCLVFGIYDTVANRNDIINKLTGKLKVPIHEFYINNEQKNPLKLIQDINITDDHLVICFYDIEQAFPEAIGYINYQREAFFKQKWGLLFLITEFGRNEIANKAPDFWSRRSGVFDFRIKDYKQILNARETLVAEPISYQSKDELLKKLNLYKSLLEEYKTDKEPDEKTIAHLFFKIGQIYSLSSDYTQSYEWFNKSIEIFEKIGDNQGVASSLHNIGIIYQNKENYEGALKQYQKSLEISEKIEDNQGVASNLHNIGTIYQNKGNYDEALKQYQKSLEIYEEIGDNQGVAGNLLNVGMIYQNEGNYDGALNHYRKSLEIS
ncbi:MAG: tetratricopeptide repeat protein [Candidatus Firestonebacteria bacterium]|nr:tetratricopeptide repeat protein [Candidatus Firestonebacteria bacterium]